MPKKLAERKIEINWAPMRSIEKLGVRSNEQIKSANMNYKINIFRSTYPLVIAKFFLGIEFQEGIAALIVLLLINFSINFFFLGIIGEYIGRTFKKEEISMPAIIR